SMTLEELEWIHDRKTGALIVASLEVGLLAGGGDPALLPALREYGSAIGRAFQITDDLLDVTGTAAELGKQPGQDAAHGKATYPSLLGLEPSRAAAAALAERAAGLAAGMGAAGGVDSRSELLQDLAFHVIARKS